jgi:hypothetical protein
MEVREDVKGAYRSEVLDIGRWRKDMGSTARATALV